MLYEVTVEDPQVLLQPWTLNPMLRTAAPPPPPPGSAPPPGGGGGGGFGGAGLIGSERGACQEEELDDIDNQIRH
jgi:hypothetical protein